MEEIEMHQVLKVETKEELKKKTVKGIRRTDCLTRLPVDTRYVL